MRTINGRYPRASGIDCLFATIPAFAGGIVGKWGKSDLPGGPFSPTIEGMGNEKIQEEETAIRASAMARHGLSSKASLRDLQDASTLPQAF